MECHRPLLPTQTRLDRRQKPLEASSPLETEVAWVLASHSRMRYLRSGLKTLLEYKLRCGDGQNYEMMPIDPGVRSP